LHYCRGGHHTVDNATQVREARNEASVILAEKVRRQNARLGKTGHHAAIRDGSRLGFRVHKEGTSANIAGMRVAGNPCPIASRVHRRWQDGWNSSPQETPGWKSAVWS
jgi:hypothetical protein